MSRLASFLLVATIFLGMLLLRSCGANDEMKDQVSSYKSLYDLEHQKAVVFKDKSDKWRARATAAEATAEAVKDVVPEMIAKIDGLKKDLSNAENIIATSTVSEGSISTVLIDTIYIDRNDTIQAKTFTYNDEWSKFNGRIYGNNIDFNYQVRDSITFYQFYKGKTFFKRGELTIEGISHNPNTQISGLMNIKIIEPKRRKISIGPTFTYGFSSNGAMTWNIGIGVQWKWIEL